jgi:hypothetical protein
MASWTTAAPQRDRHTHAFRFRELSENSPLREFRKLIDESEQPQQMQQTQHQLDNAWLSVVSKPRGQMIFGEATLHGSTAGRYSRRCARAVDRRNQFRTDSEKHITDAEHIEITRASAAFFRDAVVDTEFPSESDGESAEMAAAVQARTVANIKFAQGKISKDEHRQVVRSSMAFPMDDVPSPPAASDLTCPLDVPAPQAVMAAMHNCFAFARDDPSGLKQAARIASAVSTIHRREKKAGPDLCDKCDSILRQLIVDEAALVKDTCSAVAAGLGGLSVEDALRYADQYRELLDFAVREVCPSLDDVDQKAALFHGAATSQIEKAVLQLIAACPGQARGLSWGEALQEHELRQQLQPAERTQLIAFIRAWNLQAEENRLPKSILLQTAARSLQASPPLAADSSASLAAAWEAIARAAVNAALLNPTKTAQYSQRVTSMIQRKLVDEKKTDRSEPACDCEPRFTCH